MAKINKVDFEENTITFNCDKRELDNLNLSENYLLINNNLDKDLKLVKRGKNEPTMYILLDKQLKSLLDRRLDILFNTKNNVYVKSKIIKSNDSNYLVIRL